MQVIYFKDKWHRVATLILKYWYRSRVGSTGGKWQKSASKQTLNTLIPCPASGADCTLISTNDLRDGCPCGLGICRLHRLFLGKVPLNACHFLPYGFLYLPVSLFCLRFFPFRGLPTETLALLHTTSFSQGFLWNPGWRFQFPLQYLNHIDDNKLSR